MGVFSRTDRIDFLIVQKIFAKFWRSSIKIFDFLKILEIFCKILHFRWNFWTKKSNFLLLYELLVPHNVFHFDFSPNFFYENDLISSFLCNFILFFSIHAKLFLQFLLFLQYFLCFSQFQKLILLWGEEKLPNVFQWRKRSTLCIYLFFFLFYIFLSQRKNPTGCRGFVVRLSSSARRGPKT